MTTGTAQTSRSSNAPQAAETGQVFSTITSKQPDCDHTDDPVNDPIRGFLARPGSQYAAAM
ncbi:hypothetical protein [Actinacidiphila soli]|uniref:hypothetical protein n=1 Tax=Actinacidiphila soli TaxID=2487275 RepID=UPI000FCCB511|nr:hypothetical protein [Actinacidiphila soli]